MQNDRKFDRRIVERNIKKNIIGEKDYVKYLKDLEDLDDKCEILEILDDTSDMPSADDYKE